MSDKQPKEETTRIEQAVVKRKKGISPVWILPIIAALIGGWLLYKGIAEAPIEVVINFDTGEGITAGKTKVIFKGLNAGVVQSLKMNPDLKSVDVTVDFDQRAKPILLNNTEFWLVKPRLSLTEVSGLGTVLKGNHIAMRVSDWGDKPALSFKALDEPPPVSEDAPGLHLTLVSRKLSVGYGSPVNYKGIEVGDVQSYKLSEDKQEVQTKIFIQPQYSHLVNEKTRFWNAGGISVSGGLSGLKIRTESLEAILTGGLAFYTPENEPNAPAVQNGNIFKLYDDYESANQNGVPIKITFDSAEGLDKDAEIKYHGITVGKVDSVTFSQSLKKVTLSAHLDQSAGAMASEGTQFWVVKPEFGLAKVSNLGTLITGDYIAVLPAKKKGKLKSEFIGQRKPPAEAPPVPEDAPGLHLTLVSKDLSVGRGSPVYYKGIEVGDVQSYKLPEDKQEVETKIFIQPQYSHLVNEHTRFWNAGGISVSGGLSGLKIRTESLEAILTGGLAFYTPEGEPNATAVQNGNIFKLFDDYESAHQTGVPIKITFDSAEGLDKDTEIKYHGITVGKVDSVTFGPSLKKVTLSAHLDQSAGAMTSEGTQFWVVKPEFGLSKVSHLGTLITGAYIAVQPAMKKGKPKNEFIGQRKPSAEKPAEWGLNIILTADQLGSIKVGDKVYYREIVVGEVSSYELADTADHVRIYLNIQKRYTLLVRENSVFWNSSGIGVDFGLFSGLKIQTESLESMMSGGVAFATPDNEDMGEQVNENAVFPLHSEMEKDWLKWKPRIELTQ